MEGLLGWTITIVDYLKSFLYIKTMKFIVYTRDSSWIWS